MLTKEELKKLKEEVLKLEKINDVEKLFPKKSAYQFLFENNKDRLYNTALNYLGRKYSYKELFDKIDLATCALKECGVKPGDNVAMAMLTTPESIITFYAINKIGAVSYMINATHEEEALKDELKEANANLLIVNDIFYSDSFKKMVDNTSISKVVTTKLNDSFPACFLMDKVKFKLIENLKRINSSVKKDKKCINWSNFLELGEEIDVIVPAYYEENYPISIASTSGSTGKPKKPVITNENINAMPIQMGMTCDAFAPNDSIFTTLPIWIFYSLVNSIHEPLCLGVTVDMDPLLNSKKISKRMKQYRFNHWNTIPSYIEDMVKDKKLSGLDLSHLKTITTGGDFRTPKLKVLAENKLRENNSFIEIGQGYGTSETCGSFCYTYKPNMNEKSVGEPLVGNKFKIINLETGEICKANESGELYLYSPSLMKEYLNDEKETSKTIIVNDDGVKWYKTEDMAHFDENGEIYIDGRLRRIVISKDSKGMPTKVFPDKVKQIISLHPSVEQCEIIMVPDTKRITRPVAYVVLKDGISGSTFLEEEIDELYKTYSIESYSIPSEYRYISKMPKTQGLKVDLSELEKQYEEEKNNSSFQKVLKR